MSNGHRRPKLSRPAKPPAKRVARTNASHSPGLDGEHDDGSATVRAVHVHQRNQYRPAAYFHIARMRAARSTRGPLAARFSSAGMVGQEILSNSGSSLGGMKRVRLAST